MSRILIVDDERDLVWALERTLTDEGHEVEAAYDGAQALAAAGRNRPDLVILDVVIPRLDGLEVCQTLRRDPSLAAVPILFLSARNTVLDRVKGLDEGADDYLTKPFELQELRARVRALLRRAGKPSQGNSEHDGASVLEAGPLILDLRTSRLTVEQETRQLTPTECDLVRYLMTHPRQAFSSEQLLRKVWGYSPESADPGLVRWHVKNIREKIERDPRRPRFILTIPRHGFVLDVTPTPA